MLCLLSLESCKTTKLYDNENINYLLYFSNNYKIIII